MLLNQCKKLTAPWIGIVYCLLLVSAGVFIFKQLQTSDNPRSFFTADPQLLSEEAELQSVLSSYEPATYLVVAGDSEQAVFDRLEELFAQQPRARGLVFGIHQLLPSPKLRQQYLQQNDRLYGEAGIAQTFLAQLGVNADEVSSLLLSYQQAQQHPPTAQQLMDGKTLPLPPLWAMIDNKHYHFLLLQSGVELDPLRSFAESNDHIYFIDTVGMSTDVIRSLRQSALSLLTIALALIAILLLIRYRSLRKLGLLAVPIAAITITLGLFSLFGVAVSLFHTMALFLVLGLGMDYVIFVADLYSEDKQSQRTLCAVLLSAMTSLLAFGLLSLSDLPAVQAFGVTVLVGNTINIIGSVFVMRFLNAAN